MSREISTDYRYLRVLNIPTHNEHHVCLPGRLRMSRQSIFVTKWKRTIDGLILTSYFIQTKGKLYTSI